MRRVGFVSLFLLLAATLLAGAEQPRCVPVPVEDGVTLTVEQAVYGVGETVSFEVDPGGTAIYVQSGDMNEPWEIHRRDARTGEWERIRAGMPFGCYAIECVDGEAIWLCADPAPPFCEEHLEAFTRRWRGTHWFEEQVPCGDALVEMWLEVPAPAGDYRVRHRYGLDGMTGATPYSSQCLDQGESVEDFFTISEPMD